MAKTVEEIEAGGEVHVAGYDAAMPAELFIINRQPKANVSIVEDGDLTVSVDTTLTDELIAEGYLRDILRQCQVFRKEADFSVSDRIDVSFAGDAAAMKIVEDNKDYISSELLAEIFDSLIGGAEYCGKIELDIGALDVSMKRK